MVTSIGEISQHHLLLADSDQPRGPRRHALLPDELGGGKPGGQARDQQLLHLLVSLRHQVVVSALLAVKEVGGILIHFTQKGHRDTQCKLKHINYLPDLLLRMKC